MEQLMESVPSSKERQHLKLLGLFYIIFGVLGVLNLFGLCMIPLFEKALIGFQENVDMSHDQTEAVKATFRVLSLCLIALTIVHVFFNVLVGICLIRHWYYTACFLAGILTCLAFPLGTILGIFTLIVLSKTETKRLFGRTIPEYHAS